MPRKKGQLCMKYHKALVLAIKDQVEKVKSRIASEWVNEWKEELGGKVVDEVEFRERFQGFLSDELSFADRSDVTLEKDKLKVAVEGCALCPGNDLLRQAGEQTLCPIIPTGLFAISRVLGRKVSLDGVEKSGQVGTCNITYSLGEKKG